MAVSRDWSKPAALVAPVLDFLRCRTLEAWAEAAADDLQTLLLDHAALELKAAQQAQTLIGRYGTAGENPALRIVPGMRLELVRKLSRLAREELRHFEQVIELLAARGIAYSRVSASRYARTLHEAIRPMEPGRCIDTLIVGAIIEARSCERFFSLLPRLEMRDPELNGFYRSLLRSEARHFRDYVALARAVAGREPAERIERFLELDAVLVSSADGDTRFHSGPPARSATGRAGVKARSGRSRSAARSDPRWGGS